MCAQPKGSVHNVNTCLHTQLCHTQDTHINDDGSWTFLHKEKLSRVNSIQLPQRVPRASLLEYAGWTVACLLCDPLDLLHSLTAIDKTIDHVLI